MSTADPNYDANAERDQVPFPPGATQQMAGQPAQVGPQQGAWPNTVAAAGSPTYQQAQWGNQQPPSHYPQPFPYQYPPAPQYPQQPQIPGTAVPYGGGLPYGSGQSNPQPAPPQAGPGSILHTGQSLDWSQAADLVRFLRGIEPARLVSLARIFMTMFDVDSPSVEYALTLIEKADMGRIWDAIEWLIQRNNDPSAVQAAGLGLGFGEYLALIQLIAQFISAIQRNPQQNVQAIRALVATP